MVDSNFGMHKPLKINSGNPVQNDRTQGNNAVRPQNFEPVRNKNPCHDGCKVKPEQIEAKAAEPAPTQQNEGTPKV